MQQLFGLQYIILNSQYIDQTIRSQLIFNYGTFDSFLLGLCSNGVYSACCSAKMAHKLVHQSAYCAKYCIQCDMNTVSQVSMTTPLHWSRVKHNQQIKVFFTIKHQPSKRTRSSWPWFGASWQISGFHMKQTAEIFSICLIYDFLKPLKI